MVRDGALPTHVPCTQKAAYLFADMPDDGFKLLLVKQLFIVGIAVPKIDSFSIPFQILPPVEGICLLSVTEYTRVIEHIVSLFLLFSPMRVCLRFVVPITYAEIQIALYFDSEHESLIRCPRVLRQQVIQAGPCVSTPPQIFWVILPKIVFLRTRFRAFYLG